MKDIDDLDLKEEIDRISKRIDAIVQQVEQKDPARKENKAPEREY